MELRARVHSRLGVQLPATVAFDHPTLQVLAEKLHLRVIRWPISLALLVPS